MPIMVPKRMHDFKYTNTNMNYPRRQNAWAQAEHDAQYNAPHPYCPTQSPTCQSHAPHREDTSPDTEGHSSHWGRPIYGTLLGRLKHIVAVALCRDPDVGT